MDIIPTIEGEVEDVVESNILTEKMSNLIKTILPKREYEIIKYRYGLEGCPALPQREVAQKLGISRSYISRLETKALETIRNEVENQGTFS